MVLFAWVVDIQTPLLFSAGFYVEHTGLIGHLSRLESSPGHSCGEVFSEERRITVQIHSRCETTGCQYRRGQVYVIEPFHSETVFVALVKVHRVSIGKCFRKYDPTTPRLNEHMVLNHAQVPCDVSNGDGAHDVHKLLRVVYVE